MGIQILLLIFIFGIFVKIMKQYAKRKITALQLFFWFVFWLGAALLVLLPEITNRFADWFGVGRGADFVIYVSLIFIFFSLFHIFVRLQKTEQDISELVSTIALMASQKKESDRKE